MKEKKNSPVPMARPFLLAAVAVAAVAAALVLALILRPPATAGATGDRAGAGPGAAAAPSAAGAAGKGVAAANDGAVAAGAPPTAIRVGSYNLAIFGSAKTGRPATLAAIATVLTGFDLGALQEVGSNDSAASDASCEVALAALAAAMAKAAGGELFGWVRGGQFAFVYRKDRLEVESWALYAGAEAFSYPPLGARFRVRGTALDFAALTVHVSPGKAREEIPRLSRAMGETAAALGEPDVICLGDFNADGSYFDEGPEPGLPGFPAPDFVSVIPDEADTTVGREELAYDRIVLTGAMAGDFTGGWGIVKPAELLDLSACEGPGGWAGTERALSDHYPVWADFATALDAD